MPVPQFISMEQVADLCMLTRGLQDLPLFEYTSSLDFGAPHLGILTPELQDTLERVNGLPQDLQMQFVGLRLMLEEFSTAEHLRQCGSALDLLQKLYCDIYEFDHDTHITQASWRWMANLSTEFVTLIEVCYPPALVILAHFAAATVTSITTSGVRPAKRAWFMTGWGKHVLAGISLALIGNEWHQWLEWPLELARHDDVEVSKTAEIANMTRRDARLTRPAVAASQYGNVERNESTVL